MGTRQRIRDLLDDRPRMRLAMELRRRNAEIVADDSYETQPRVSDSHSRFQFSLWFLLAVENWLLDFGRPIAMLLVPLKYSPLSLPSVGDYFHMAYNVITPYCLLKLMERAPRKVSSTLSYLAIIFFVMGASIHLVGDSVNHRLVHSGYQLHLSVADNPIMKQLKPSTLVHSFELLYYYDEHLGHLMWYIPFFFVLLLYFAGSFVSDKTAKEHPLTTALSMRAWLLLIFSAAYYWYLVTEGQIFPLFLFSYTIMLLMVLTLKHRGLCPDSNARFLLLTFTSTMFLVIIWILFLWNNQDMRLKYPGLVYVPEPWAFYSSCCMSNYH